MGFWKVLAGIGAGIGAVVAAPVVLPALAATGAAAAAAAGTAAATVGATAAAAGATVATAAGTAAAAVGTAATAAGAAAAGAVGAAGTAIAGTAVGSAATAAMGTVGAGIGAAAGALSSAPVIGAAAGTVSAMAGSSAGAAALGTVATTGVIGAANGVSGAVKLSEAKDIHDEAMRKYNKKHKTFEKREQEVNDTLKELGTVKAPILSNYERFVEAYSKIQNMPEDKTFNTDVELLTITPEKLDHLKAVAISAKALLSGGISSVAAGNLIGLATSGSLISGIATASTGTAISSLSGAAASNAILAALGGGTLQAGGAGVAGGTIAMGGLAFAPMLMIGGIMLNHKAKQAVENAEENLRQAENAVAKMQKIETEFDKLEKLRYCVKEELQEQFKAYDVLVGNLEELVARCTDGSQYSRSDWNVVEKAILSITFLCRLCEQDLLDQTKEDLVVLDQDTYDQITAAKQVRDTKLQYA